ncbi:unnamed protein product [Rotaria magnacalcarata]|nr:unnamed protein product [Rotaria magnacalcarata]CAF2222484.1 unnamed protein product [Rotaria magnacalcarata]
MSESHSSLSISNDKKPTMEEIDALPTHPVQFTAEYLLACLEPIIQKMIDSEELFPFRQPVALNATNYSTIIEHPMDISGDRNFGPRNFRAGLSDQFHTNSLNSEKKRIFLKIGF